jgi:hypothetical protein
MTATTMHNAGADVELDEALSTEDILSQTDIYAPEKKHGIKINKELSYAILGVKLHNFVLE